MAARSKRAESEARQPDSVGPATDRNRALAALAAKGEVLDAARDNPLPGPPKLTGVEHDLGGDVRGVLVAPSMVLPVEGGRLFVYRGEVVKADAGFFESRSGFVRL